MNNDRNARVISTAVLLFAVVLTVHLASNPRGQGGWFFGDDTASPTDSSVFDPAGVIGEVGEVTDIAAEAESSRVQVHLSQLAASKLELSRDEISTVAADTMYDAVAKLRPYWLNEDLRASVSVGGQLLGNVAVLNDINPTLVEEARLAFSPTEPHWIIQVFMEP